MSAWLKIIGFCLLVAVVYALICICSSLLIPETDAYIATVTLLGVAVGGAAVLWAMDRWLW